jgi:hypothetical protein
MNDFSGAIVTPSTVTNDKEKNSGYGKLFHYLNEMKKGTYVIWIKP